MPAFKYETNFVYFMLSGSGALAGFVLCCGSHWRSGLILTGRPTIEDWSERQLDFRKAESMPEKSGREEMSLMPGGKSFSSSPLEKLHPMGGNYMNFLEPPRTFLSKGQKARTSAGNNLLGAESPSNLSVTCLGASNPEIFSQENPFMQPAPNGFHYENSLFSSSLSETFGKSVLLSSEAHFGKSVDANDSKFVEDGPLESLKEIEAQTIGDLLPNDDDLLSGVIDDIECVAQANSGDEDDLFCSGGGMELESDESFNCSRTSDFIRGVNGTYAGEVYGKQTSRILLVRNIKSNVEDAELRILFEQFGDIRRLHTVSKNQGFVLVSYYDIRSARNAMRAIQDRLLRQHKIDLNYYFPKQENSSEHHIDNDTLIVFNLDSTVSSDDIRQIFGSYGEIKEIFHDSCNQNQRAIEFYDVRAAEAAFYALNMSEIAGKRIKIEPVCAGAGWRCLGRQSSLELELEGSTICMNGSSPSNSMLEIGAQSRTIGYGANISVGLDSGSIQSSALQTLISPFMESKFPGISSTVPRSMSSPIRVTMVGNHSSQSNLDDLSHSLGQMNFGFQNIPTFHPHSLPEFHNGPISSIPYNTIRAVPSMGTNINSRIADGIDTQQNRQGPGHINSHSFDHKEGKAISPINGHQYIQNNSNINFHHSPGSLMWQNSPSFVNNFPAAPQPLHGLPRGPSHIMNNFVPLHHHHVGSAPALNPSLWGRRTTYAGDCIEAPSIHHPGSLGNMGFSGSSQMHPFGISSHNIFTHDCRNCIDPSASPHVGSPSPQQRSHILHGRNSLNSAATAYDSPGERIRSRRCDSTASQLDNKKQFDLDISRIVRGEDSRTTLMIKNIPNKYTSKMLLATIDEHHKGTYDFIYLPIDFKNKCNVGYAFINLNDPKHIIPFHQAFNGKKWEKFNSEKVASLAYARIQGKAALIAHFQNSSLMNEDKRCRPILFHSDGPNAGDQEPFPMGTHIRSRPGRSRTTNNEEAQPRSPPDSGNGDDLSNNSTDSSSSSAKD
ncbi:protein MEI2-like 4 isoform X1 [Dendrobium catenatum]|uniref:protein MEI2-like 4 isoform X1 n=1 Tax=Dendrobium catenatum TaxID=906689 RepID=UPI0009F48DCF|nr:protein MEI2-like 4 isoform X1 [Dendrobium catenatum]